MKKKLTLVVDETVIDRAKRHAVAHETSVSELVEQYLVEATADEAWSPPPHTALARITGAVMPTDDQPPLGDALERERWLREKHA